MGVKKVLNEQLNGSRKNTDSKIEAAFVTDEHISQQFHLYLSSGEWKDGQKVVPRDSGKEHKRSKTGRASKKH